MSLFNQNHLVARSYLHKKSRFACNINAGKTAIFENGYSVLVLD